jgi:hypothetical protein
MSNADDASVAFQIILFLYMMIFLLVFYFYFKGNVENAKIYFIATLVIYPVISILNIGLSAAAL